MVIVKIQHLLNAAHTLSVEPLANRTNKTQTNNYLTIWAHRLFERRGGVLQQFLYLDTGIAVGA